jgi:hypothetical protein
VGRGRGNPLRIVRPMAARFPRMRRHAIVAQARDPPNRRNMILSLADELSELIHIPDRACGIVRIDQKDRTSTLIDFRGDRWQVVPHLGVKQHGTAGPHDGGGGIDELGIAGFGVMNSAPGPPWRPRRGPLNDAQRANNTSKVSRSTPTMLSKDSYATNSLRRSGDTES